MKDHSAERREKAESILKGAGYDGVKELVDHQVEKAINQHDAQLHDGKKTRLKLKTGGAAKGKAPAARLDRKPRATGGRNKHKESKVSVNIINAGSKQPMPVPAMPPMAAAPRAPMPVPAPAAPMRPPMGAGAPAPMPAGPGAMPQRPFKAGGPVRTKMDIPHLSGGAGGGLGRLEKAEHESKRKKAV